MKTPTREMLWGLFLVFSAVPISLIMPLVGIIGGVALIITSIVLRAKSTEALQHLFLRYVTIAGMVGIITGLTFILANLNITNNSIPT
ncbi:MAG: hypothetical protein GFH27_549311n133 [Chloroflexi bacterium AL-W]|nr:hypothetical protein [Chloroflexi bacterium AL-N1]NOK68689.1 hypothetical protein [Chloroflexi bacterium AL-N10]NOK76175.1 hypothetical protein [Chloroflexi bacterium AL-N5]NOK84188.1 hypothetical protein [Chloroflexi bacterium AL-W]NOK91313.1 hypothetical protein [Chloroflexi bacterium AL-N15]